MSPEEKAARRFSQLRKLKPPVDVETLIREAANLEEDFLPAGYDAVFLDKSAKRPKPRVVIEATLPSTRRAFTLAHELGHIVIPWHNGTHFCRVEGDLRLVDDLTRQVESEANRFAGELLMPAEWTLRLVKSASKIGELVETVRTAGVSYHAASIRLIKLLPSGYVFAELDNEGNLIRSTSSKDTWIHLPPAGSAFMLKASDPLVAEFASFSAGRSKLVWYKLNPTMKPPKQKHGAESSRELLKKICVEEFGETQKAKTAMMQVNGVIGAANGITSGEGQGDLFTIFKQRFLMRHELSAVVNHEEFDTFLAMRADEIEARRAPGE